MRVVLLWAKNNFIILLAAVICLLSLGLQVYIHIRGTAFVEDMKGVGGKINKTNQLEETDVRVPPEEADGEPRALKITINQPAIDALDQAYQKMDAEYRNIYQYAVSLNSKDHLPMVEGLFPDPAKSGPTKSYEARTRYRRSFEEMFEPYSPTAGYPQINAKQPMSLGDLESAFRRLESDFRNSKYIINPAEALSLQHAAEFRELKTKNYVDIIRRYAEGANIFAVVDPTSTEYPFDVGAWSTQVTLPSPRDLWEGQMGLWIQQDIARAIALTNRVDFTPSNVTNAPIKRLVRIQIVPGYVGVGPAKGGVTMQGPTEGRNFGTFFDAGAVAAPTPPAGAPARGKPAAAEAKPVNDFVTSPTGRISNPIYDVIHVWVRVVVDYQRLPTFFDNLSQVNFMTILKWQITDVDEYKAMEDRVLYGSGDCVEASILIETIWLRDWTAKLMPPDVRNYLGVPDPNAPPPATGTSTPAKRGSR